MSVERNRVWARLAGDLAGRGVAALAEELVQGWEERELLAFLICLLLCCFVSIAIAVALALPSRLYNDLRRHSICAVSLAISSLTTAMIRLLHHKSWRELSPDDRRTNKQTAVPPPSRPADHVECLLKRHASSIVVQPSSLFRNISTAR